MNSRRRSKRRAWLLAAVVVSSSPLGGDFWRQTAPGKTLWGFADLHAHFFNSMAYGGRVIHGRAWAPGGIAEALDDCASDHGTLFGRSSAILAEGGRHRTAGYPDFTDWPSYNGYAHQQAYVDWIRRAWQGGLRVVQMDAQNTAFLGQAHALVNRVPLLLGGVSGELAPLPLDDVSQIRLQLAAARELFETGPGHEFATIVRSPEEARATVRAGRLAVVLGVEVEAIGGLVTQADLGPDDASARAKIAAVLDDLWQQGVRHVIPIHVTQNAFGQPALFNRLLNSANFAELGRWYGVEEAFGETDDAFGRGIRFDPLAAPSEPISWFFELWGRWTGRSAYPVRTGPSGLRAARSSEGLTRAGEILIEEMIRRGFLLDVEHMSDKAAARAFDIAEAAGAPVMASHGSPRDLAFGTRIEYAGAAPGGAVGRYTAIPASKPFSEADPADYGTSDATKTRTERGHSLEFLQRIRRSGGLVGAGLATKGIGVSWRGRVPNDCDGSSKSFVQEVLYLNEVLGRGGYAIGSDVNGLSDLPAPRFGPNACPGVKGDAAREAGGRLESERQAQHHRVAYVQAPSRPSVATSLPPAPESPLEPSRAGHRVWDVNVDGVAHYGLIPDFLQDVSNVLSDAGAPGELAPLFQSAEAYVRMWEKAQAAARAR